MQRKLEQKTQGLQAFSFCVATGNHEHTKLKLKESLGIKCKDSICVELCLKHWFESNYYFCNITEPAWF